MGEGEEGFFEVVVGHGGFTIYDLRFTIYDLRFTIWIIARRRRGNCGAGAEVVGRD